MPSWKNTSNFDNYKQGYISPLQKYKEIINKKPFCYGKVCINLKFNWINLILAQISNILCNETASYRRKKQKTDANVTSVIIVGMTGMSYICGESPYGA